MPSLDSEDLVLDTVERSLRHVVFQRIRQAILDGAYKPGDRLRQEELASRFGISRIPVREALQRLEAEGLVTIRPHRGAIVTGFDIDEIRDSHELRAMLAGVVTEAATSKLTPLDHTHLADLIVQMLQLGPSDRDIRAWDVLNRDFHFTIYRAAGKPAFLRMIEYYFDHGSRQMRLIRTIRNAREQAIVEHCAIVDALKHRDAARARAEMEAHIIRSGRWLVDLLEGRRSDSDSD